MFETAENRNAALTAWLEQERCHGAHARGVLFRRRFRDLQSAARECEHLFPQAGARLNKADATWTFPSGAKFKLRHAYSREDAWAYSGNDFTCVIFDDAGEWQFDDYVPRYMLSTLRSAHGVSTKAVMVSSP